MLKLKVTDRQAGLIALPQVHYGEDNRQTDALIALPFLHNAEDNRQTDKQTDRQTDRQTDKLDWLH